jgi:hypothetical protein
MKNISKIFKHRFGVIAVVAALLVLLGFVTRVALLFISKNAVDFSIINVLGIFGIGLFYDLVVSCFFAVPIARYC